MIENLKPYPLVKDSGVPWLGEIPERWDLRKLRHVLRSETERNRSDLPLLSVVREKGVILRDVGNKDENHNYIPDDLSNYKVVRRGQFVMNKMKAWQGSYGVSKYDGIVSPAYFVFDLHDVDGDYFHIAIRSKSFVPLFMAASDGVRIGQWDLSQARMREIPFPLPPRDEQAAIVRFLDYVDRRIRRYIRAKQKLIALLEEQKQAIIHHAVTRGLDPNVPLKPSGVEWLGDVPAHWEVSRLSRIIADGPRNGLSPSIDEKGTVETFSISAIRNGRVEIREADRKYVTVLDRQFAKKYSLLRGDILLVRGNGNIKFVGKAGLVNQDMPERIYPDLLMRIRLTNRCRSELLVYLLNSRIGRDQIELAAKTAVGTFKVNNWQIRQLTFAFPPISEQEMILDYLDSVVRGLVNCKIEAEEGINLIREYRTRLIADVVTGKLDVREAAAQLPDETEDAEPLDDEAELDTIDDEHDEALESALEEAEA